MKNALTLLAGLSIERLRSFCLIVDAGSFVEAAQRNPVRQSQFSRQMRDLERTLGARLFVREGRHLRLTASGNRLAALTRAYFSSLQTLREEQVELKPLKVGAGESIIRWSLVPRIKEIIAVAGAPLTLDNYTTEEIRKKLEDGELDVGILRADAVRGACAALAFPAMTYVLMVPKTLATRGRMAKTRELPVVILGSEPEFEANATRIAAANGYRLKVQVRAKSFNLVTAIANNLDVAAFVPGAAHGEFPRDRFMRVDLKGIDQLTRQLAVAYNVRTVPMNERAEPFARRLSAAFAGEG